MSITCRFSRGAATSELDQLPRIPLRRRSQPHALPDPEHPWDKRHQTTVGGQPEPNARGRRASGVPAATRSAPIRADLLKRSRRRHAVSLVRCCKIRLSDSYPIASLLAHIRHREPHRYPIAIIYISDSYRIPHGYLIAIRYLLDIC